MKKKVSIDEHHLQSLIFAYTARLLPDLRKYMFAIPNGGQRHIAVAVKLKHEGVTSGVYDIFISLPNIVKHGLYIECKVGDNKLTENQIKFSQLMEEVGYTCRECRSLDDFEDIVRDYFGLDKLSNNEFISRIECERFIQNNHEYNK